MSNTGEPRRTLLMRWAIVAIALLASLKILITSGLALHGDMASPLSMQAALDQFNGLWDLRGLVSNMENVDRLIVVFPIFSLLNVLHADPVWIERIWVFTFLTVSGLGALTFIQRLADRLDVRIGWLALFGAAAYMFTPWVMEFVQGPFLWIAYAVFPSFLTALDDLLVTPRLSIGVALRIALFWTLASMIPHTFVFFGVVAVIVLGIRTREVHAAQLKTAVAAIAAFTLINFYWIYVTVKSLQVAAINPGYTFTPSQLDLFSRNATLLHALIGREEWVYWFNPPYETALWYTIVALVPIAAAFAGFIALRAWRSPLAVSVLVVFAVFLAGVVGSHDPVYRWLAFDAPGANAYGWLLRGPGKLGFALPLFFCALGAILIARVWAWSRLAGALIAIMVIGSTAATELPKAASYLWYYYVPVQVPAAYYDASKWLETNGLAHERVLEEAPYAAAQGQNSLAYEASFDWDAARLAGNFIVRSLPVDAMGRYHFTSQAWTPLYEELRYRGYPASLLREAHIRYIFFHDDLVGAHASGAAMYAKLRRAGLTPVFHEGSVTILRVPGQLTPVVSGPRGEPIARVLRFDRDKITFSCDASSAAIRFALPPDPYWQLDVAGRVRGPSAYRTFSLYNARCAPNAVGTFTYLPDVWLQRAIGYEAYSTAIVLFGVLLIIIVPRFSAYRARIGIGPVEH